MFVVARAGLRGHLKGLTWPVVDQLVDAVVPVDEPAVLRAMRLIYERMKLVVEPSGAVGLAAALEPSFVATLAKRGQQRIGVVLCGGNLDLGTFFELMSKQPPS